MSSSLRDLLWVSFGIWSLLYVILLGHWSLHVFGVGALLCLFSYLAIPPPSSSVFSGLEDLGVIGHRAGGNDGAPENTLEALQLASSRSNFKTVEFDISMSSDGIPVVFHDDLVDRLAVSDKGPICQMTWSSIQKIPIRNKLLAQENDKVCYIPKVEDFVNLCLEKNLNMIMDLKLGSSRGLDEALVSFILSLFVKFPVLYDKALVSSFYPQLIYTLRSKNPKISCSLAYRPGLLAYETYSGNIFESRPRYNNPIYHSLALFGDICHDFAFHHILWYLLGLRMVLVSKDIISRDYISRWKSKGVNLIAWTINDSVQKAYFSKCYSDVPYMSDSLESVPIENIFEDSMSLLN